jgi:hypothetical protein
MNAIYSLNHKVAIRTVPSISIKWIVKEYVRITVGSFSVLVSDSSIGLICRFKVAISGGTSATGLLGNTDNSWWKDLVSPTDQTNANSSFIDNNLSALYTGSWTKQDFDHSSDKPQLSGERDAFEFGQRNS